MLAIKTLAGDLRTSALRSVAWKVFLSELPFDKFPTATEFNSTHKEWKSSITKFRSQYDQLINKYLFDPRKKSEEMGDDVELCNPLAQDANVRYFNSFDILI